MRALRVRSIMPFLLLAASMAGVAASAPAAHATSTFTVNSTADLKDADLGDGVCKASNGLCTLRAAVQQANATGGTAVIKLSKLGTYSITLGPAGEEAAAGGDLDIHTDTTIKGLGAAKTIVRVDRTKVKDRVFQVAANVAATFSGITIANGDAVGDEGGAIENKSGSTVRLVRDVLRDNKAGGSGGAVSDGGSLFLVDTVIDHNVSANNGGAIRDYFEVTLVGSTLSGNTAAGGGGAIDGDRFSLTNSTVEGNTGFGAGLLANDKPDKVAIVNSTVSGNSPTNLSAHTATLTNSILANSGSGGDCNVTKLTSTNSLIEDTTNCAPSGSGNLTGTDPGPPHGEPGAGRRDGDGMPGPRPAGGEASPGNGLRHGRVRGPLPGGDAADRVRGARGHVHGGLGGDGRGPGGENLRRPLSGSQAGPRLRPVPLARRPHDAPAPVVHRSVRARVLLLRPGHGRGRQHLPVRPRAVRERGEVIRRTVERYGR